MDKTHTISFLMVIRSLDLKKYLIRHFEKSEDLFGPEIPYLSVIGALMYFANCTRPTIAFFVNLITMYNSALT